MNGDTVNSSGVCIKSAMNYSAALSPAFILQGKIDTSYHILHFTQPYLYHCDEDIQKLMKYCFTYAEILHFSFAYTQIILVKLLLDIN